MEQESHTSDEVVILGEATQPLEAVNEISYNLAFAI